jgi:hypothetical protein
MDYSYCPSERICMHFSLAIVSARLSNEPFPYAQNLCSGHFLWDRYNFL